MANLNTDFECVFIKQPEYGMVDHFYESKQEAEPREVFKMLSLDD
jgi:hypothetical protein